jgi:hypothetical protein
MGIIVWRWNQMERDQDESNAKRGKTCHCCGYIHGAKIDIPCHLKDSVLPWYGGGSLVSAYSSKTPLPLTLVTAGDGNLEPHPLWLDLWPDNLQSPPLLSGSFSWFLWPCPTATGESVYGGAWQICCRRLSPGHSGGMDSEVLRWVGRGCVFIISVNQVSVFRGLLVSRRCYRK